jgi:hypothetical protein
MNTALLDPTEATATERQFLRDEFLRYASSADFSMPCLAGELVSTGDILRTGEESVFWIKRRQTIAEMISEAIEDSHLLSQAIEILCRVAQGQDMRDTAKALLLGAAEEWAERKSEL